MVIRFLLAFLMLGLCTVSSSFADPNGQTSRTGANVGCGGSGCHGSSASTSATVTVTSKSGTFTTTPGGKLELTVVVAHATQKSAGFNLAIKATQNGASNSGGIFTAGTGSKVLFSEMTHSTPMAMSGGKAEFSFTWTAPNKEGTFFLQAVGNAVNDDGRDGGDAWNWVTPIPVVVKAASGVEENSTPMPSLSVYPNPTTSTISLNYSLPASGNYQYLITDATGRTIYSEAAKPELSGDHTKVWNCRTIDGATVANGTYYAILRSDEHTVSVPFAVVR